MGVADTRPLALFRIALGLVLLQDLWVRAHEVRAFLTDDGIFPFTTRSVPSAWSIFELTGGAGAISAMLAVGAVATLAFTLGLFTRAATAVAWVFWLSLHNRVLAIQTGGDTLADCLLFLSLFTDLGGRFSLDAMRRGPRAETRALVVRGMQYLPAVLYLYTARAKLAAGAGAWLGGPIIYEHMHLHGWVRPMGAWLGEHAALCRLAATGTIVAEVLIPLLVVLPFWIRPTRAIAVLLHVGLQLGILATLKVGVFTNVMLATTALWLLPEWLDRVSARKGSETSAWSRPTTAMSVSFAAIYLLAVASPVIPRHLPRKAVDALPWLGLDLKIGLFVHGYPSERWEARGELVGGGSVDPIAMAVPGADFGNGFANSLWMQLPYRMTDHAALGRYVCRAYNEGSGARLATWTLTHVETPPRGPEEDAGVEDRRVLLVQGCGEM